MPDRSHVAHEVRRTFGDRLEAVEERLRSASQAELPGGADMGPEHPGLEELPPGDLPDTALASGVQAAVLQERQDIVAAGTDGLRKVIEHREADLTAREQAGLEAIIVLEGRPPLFIQNGDFLQTPPEWQVLDGHRDRIKASIARVGRVEVEGHPNYEWIGTGFLAGPNAIVTNRHVAQEFARADGETWQFQSGMSVQLDFNEEHGALQPISFDITGIIGIHERFDLAVLAIAPTGGSGALPDPLVVAAAQPGPVTDRQVYVIGYPAWDGRRNDPAYMRQIFSEIYDVKRLQPGIVTEWVDGSNAFVHDCSTLGGNSGSPVFDLDSHAVIGLHYGGRYLVGNNAIPLWRLTGDPLLQAAGINFATGAEA
jgi:hypothetical protein